MSFVRPARAVIAACLLSGWTGLSMVTAAEPSIDFDRQIRPILSENCFQCHGPAEQGRAADLRLDTLDGATKKHGDLAAIVPGQPQASELVKRIRSADPDQLMPPPKSNHKLTAVEKDLLERWIAAGANYSQHWAFIPPVRPAVPATRPETGLVRNPLDAFLLARLEREGMKAAPEADRARLFRRITIDLTGLPPTSAELDAYLADAGPEAYDRTVERLLSSPRYGERMVWEWLDAARYADTNGYQGDPTRAMWYWRDWAVAALNGNQPFDQFTLEQLAGDLLPSPTQAQLIATGFHRNHMINGEGGRIAEESRIDYVQDRVETTGTVWLGLTFNCCRCHDHKFDPIAQREYYQLAAYFNSIEETGGNDARGLANPVMSLASAEQQQRLTQLRDSEQQANKARDTAEQAARAEQADWEAKLVAAGTTDDKTPLRWTPLEPNELTAEHGTTLKHLGTGVVSAEGTSPPQETYTLLFPAPGQPVTGLLLEALPDERFPNSGPGRADNGNFVLSELIVEVYGARVDYDPLRVDFAQDGWPAAAVNDGKWETGWAVLPAFGKPHQLTVAFKQPLNVAAERPLVIRLAFRTPHVQHTLGRFRLSMTTEPMERLRGLAEDVRTALAVATKDRTSEQQQLVTKHYLDNHAAIVAARNAANTAKTARDDFERNLPRTMVMRDRAQPRETFVLLRGAYDKPADKVTQGVPDVLPKLPADAPGNRLALAEWIIRPDHPLTARVVVNRMWQTFFGVGLVKTSEDFGSQGEPPVHPELLDWLAREFIDSGWDVKHMHRLIVSSAAYRQSSKVDAALVEHDPQNRLLARGPRFRWPSWMLRDQALAAADLLVEHVGGPPVKGYQPTGIWEEATFGQIRYQPDTGAALYRRSVYQFWRRIVAPTMFFDIASRQTCTVKVERTNTPLQALATLNDVTYVEASRVLAERVLAETPDDPGRLSVLYRRVLSRRPTPFEQDLLLARLAQLKIEYAADTNAAAALVKVGASPVDARVSPPEIAAWTGLCQIVLNLDEALTKE